MEKKQVNEAELDQIILSHLRTRPACKDVRTVRIERLGAGPSLKWKVHSLETGMADRKQCELELERLVPQLQRRYLLV